MEARVSGAVNSVIFFNEENHFAILSIKLDRRNKRAAQYSNKIFSDKLKVLCYMDRKPIINEECSFVGQFITNQYGIQFKASKFERVNENTLSGIVNFLSNDYFPGVRKATATKIFNKLGSNCLSLIEENPDVLNEIPGISSSQKETIRFSLLNYETNIKVLLDLLNYGISFKSSLRL